MTPVRAFSPLPVLRERARVRARTSDAQSPPLSGGTGILACLLSALLLALPSCTNSKPASSRTQTGDSPTAPITNTDACAMRLHDISGGLLMYYQKYHRLPDKLDELRTLSEFPDLPEFICPVSKQPYTYVPSGISSPEAGARIVLYDPTPAHDHHRWAVSIIEPDSPISPLVTKVIALPASGFRVPQAK